METKQHIHRLPITQVHDYDRNDTQLAVCIPLFHAKTDTTFAPFNAERFRNVHCKGAIWAALSLIHNTDLAHNRVPIYFHIEDKVWEHAKPVFDAFNVPEHWIRILNVPDCGRKPPFEMNKTHFGKKYIPLLDTEVDPNVLMIYDSDAFILTEGDPLPFYDTLTSPLLKTTPAMTYFHLAKLTYQWWVQVCLMATGRPANHLDTEQLNVLEQQCFQRLGVQRELEKNLQPDDIVNRIWCDNYMVTFPRHHRVVDFTISNINICYCSPYLHAIWSYDNEPFIQLKELLGIPVYNWEREFIAAENYNCMAHIRMDRDATETKIDQYYDTFIEHLTRHIPDINLAMSNVDEKRQSHKTAIQHQPSSKTAQKHEQITYHCIGIPHLNTTDNPHAQRVADVCNTLMAADNRVIHYGHPDTDIHCTEHVSVQTPALFTALYGGAGDPNSEKYNYQDPVYTEFYIHTINALQKRIQPGDIVLCFWGIGHRPICEALLDTDVHVFSPIFLD